MNTCYVFSIVRDAHSPIGVLYKETMEESVKLAASVNPLFKYKPLCQSFCSVICWHSSSLGLPWCLSGVESACNAGSIPGLGRSPGGGHGSPLQYSCLENPVDGGAWQAAAHGVSKSQTRLTRLSTHTRTAHLAVHLVTSVPKGMIVFRFESLSC